MYGMNNNIQNGNIDNNNNISTTNSDIFTNSNNQNMNTTNNDIFTNSNNQNMNTTNNDIFTNSNNQNMNTTSNDIFTNSNNQNMNTSNAEAILSNNNSNNNFNTNEFTQNNNITYTNNINNETIPTNTSQNTNNTTENKKNTSKPKNTIISIIVLLIVIIGGLVGYAVYINNPTTLYKGIIKQGYKNFSHILDELYNSKTFNIKEDSLHMYGDFKLNSNMPELQEYTKYGFNYDFGLDVKNKKLALKANVTENLQDMLTGMIYLLDNTAYLQSSQIYNKPLYSNIEEDFFQLLSEENEITFTYKDIDKIAEKMSKYLINALNKNQFKKEKETIEVNGKKIKATKVIFQMNQNNVYEVTKSIIEDIKKDDEFIELLAKITETEKSLIKDMLNDIKLNKNDFEMDEEFELYLYTKGIFSKVIGFGLEIENDIITSVKHGKITETSIKGTDYLFIAKTTGNETKGNLKINNEEIVTFTLINEEKKDSNEITLSINAGNNEEKIELDLNVNTKQENKKKTHEAIKLQLKITSAGTTIELGSELNHHIEIDGTVADMNTSEAQDINTLTEQQLIDIQTNLENIIKQTPLYELINSMQEDNNSYSDEDWYYDDEEDWYYNDEDWY